MTLGVTSLLADYRAGRRRPSDVARAVAEAAAATTQPVWISRVPAEELEARGRTLDDADPGLALYGVPFAVKDNIDVAGMVTTAACPAYGRVAADHAPVVAALLEAGAMLVGKTNLDQFATGLVGTRSPYGAPSSVFDAARVSGGSSSGSAVAVGLDLVAFALGTDTAGSGRIPAAFNGLVGVKPTRGLVSTRGVVPACASLDCVSIFTHDVADAATVLDVIAGFDVEDPWSRPVSPSTRPRRGVVGLPGAEQARPDGESAGHAWDAVRGRVGELWSPAVVDVGPLLAAAPLLYSVWVAERTAELGAFVAGEPAGLDPTVSAIIARGETVSAVTAFAATHRIAELRRAAEAIWDAVDALVLPTALLHPTHDEVARDPVGVNDRLGRLTNFTNLLDLAAVAIPGAERGDGLPFGITLFAPAGEDRRLLELAAQWLGEPAPGSGAAAASRSVAGSRSGSGSGSRAGSGSGSHGPALELAVAGAHMRGLPLNPQLTGRGGRFLRAARTAPDYRLYALPGGPPARPGLVRVRDGGSAVEVEVWSLAPAALGSLLAEIPRPLGLGQVELEDGTSVVGFLCEGYVTEDSHDITHHGGWRAYLAAASAASSAGAPSGSPVPALDASES